MDSKTWVDDSSFYLHLYQTYVFLKFVLKIYTEPCLLFTLAISKWPYDLTISIHITWAISLFSISHHAVTWQYIYLVLFYENPSALGFTVRDAETFTSQTLLLTLARGQQILQLVYPIAQRLLNLQSSLLLTLCLSHGHFHLIREIL